MSDSVEAAMARVRPLVEKLHAVQARLEKLELQRLAILKRMEPLRDEVFSIQGQIANGSMYPAWDNSEPASSDPPAWHGLPVDDQQFALHGRVRNALLKAGYATMGDVVRSGTEWFKVVGEDGKKRILDIVQILAKHGGHPAQVTMSAENPRSGEGFEVGGVPVRSANGKGDGFAWPAPRGSGYPSYPDFVRVDGNPNLIEVFSEDRDYLVELNGAVGSPFRDIEAFTDEVGVWSVQYHGRARDLILSHASE